MENADNEFDVHILRNWCINEMNIFQPSLDQTPQSAVLWKANNDLLAAPPLVEPLLLYSRKLFQFSARSINYSKYG